MVKKQRAKAKKPAIVEDTNLYFSDIDYEIKALDFKYSFAQEPEFVASINVKVPDEYIPYPINLSLPIPLFLSLVEQTDAPMAAYVQKLIDSFDDPKTREQRAFEALKDEGFDLLNLARYALLKVSIDPTEKVERPKQIQKTFSLNEVDYDIVGVSMGYTDETPPSCIIHVNVAVPDYIFHEPIQMSFRLTDMLKSVEKKDAGMAKYMKAALAEHENEPEYEIMTFQSLISEGFDVPLFLKYGLADKEFRITQKSE